MSDSVKCNFCAETITIDEQNTYSCYMCGYGKNTLISTGQEHNNQNINICDECTMKYECSRCSGQCCPKCALNKFYCCGNGVILCGSYCPTYVNDDEEESCASRHIVKTLPCGHMGCNYHESGCWTCMNIDRSHNGRGKVQVDGATSDKQGDGQQVVLEMDNDNDSDVIIVENEDLEEDEDEMYDSDETELDEDDEGEEVLNNSTLLTLGNDGKKGEIKNIQEPVAAAFQNAEEVVEIEDTTGEDEEDSLGKNDSDDVDEDEDEDCEVIAVHSRSTDESDAVGIHQNEDLLDDLKHDKILIEQIIERAKTNSLKVHLSEWLNSSTSKKRRLV